MLDFPHYSGKMYQWPYIELVAGVMPLLERLSDSHRLYVATNAQDSDKSEITAALERASIASFFTDIFCQRELGLTKTDNDYYPAIIRALACQPQQVMMIGDTIKTDIMPALQTGLFAILVNAGLSNVQADRFYHFATFDQLMAKLSPDSL
nr:HAD family hydrolase [Neptunicella marina]